MQPMASSSQRSEAANTRQRQRTCACFFFILPPDYNLRRRNTRLWSNKRVLTHIRPPILTITSDVLSPPFLLMHRQQPLTNVKGVAVSLCPSEKQKPTALNIPYDLILKESPHLAQQCEQIKRFNDVITSATSTGFHH